MKKIFYNSKVYLKYIPRQQIYYLVSTLNNRCTWNNYRQTCERCCCNIICPFLQLHLIQSIFVHPFHSICTMTSFRSVAATTCILDCYVHTTLKFLTPKWSSLTSLGAIKIKIKFCRLTLQMLHTKSGKDRKSSSWEDEFKGRLTTHYT